MSVTDSNEEAIIRAAYTSAAEVFDTYAGDQIASKRWARSEKARRECDIRAEIWTDAASELRKAVAAPLAVDQRSGDFDVVLADAIAGINAGDDAAISATTQTGDDF